MNRIITNEMDGKRLIEKIKLRNILSFGDQGEEIELQPLNIIIGQNDSGKSNLIDVVKSLKSLSKYKGLCCVDIRFKPMKSAVCL